MLPRQAKQPKGPWPGDGVYEKDDTLFTVQSFPDNSVKVYDSVKGVELGDGTVDGSTATLSIFGSTCEVTFKEGKLAWSDGDVWIPAGTI